MEGKKKRWRPSLHEFRALEKDLESQIEGTSRLVADCDAWREKYVELEKKYNDQIEGTSQLVADCNAWREKFGKCLSDYEDLKARHEKLKIEADNAEYDLDRSVPLSQYIEIKKKFDEMADESFKLNNELSDVKEQKKVLEQSNGLMEKELQRLNKVNDRLSKKCIERGEEIAFLTSRGFWARVFDKQFVADEE